MKEYIAIFHEIRPMFFVFEKQGMELEYNKDFSILGKHKTRKVEFNVLGKKITFIWPDIFYIDYGIASVSFIPVFSILRIDGTLKNVRSSSCYYSTDRDINAYASLLNGIGYDVHCGKMNCGFRGDKLWIPVLNYGFNNSIWVKTMLSDITIQDDHFLMLKEFKFLYGVPVKYDIKNIGGDGHVYFYEGKLCVDIFHKEQDIKCTYKSSDFLRATCERDIGYSVISNVVSEICENLKVFFDRHKIRYNKSSILNLYSTSLGLVRFSHRKFKVDNYYLAVTYFINELIKRNLYKYI